MPHTLQTEPSLSAGVDLLNQFGVADCSYDLTPEQLNEKVAQSDALIVRSGTKVSIWELGDLPNFVGAMHYSASGVISTAKTGST